MNTFFKRIYLQTSVLCVIFNTIESFAQTNNQRLDKGLMPILQKYQVPHISERTAAYFDDSYSAYYTELKGFWKIKSPQSDSIFLPLSRADCMLKDSLYVLSKSFEFYSYFRQKGGIYLHLEQLSPSFEIFINGTLLNNKSYHYLTYDVTNIIRDTNTITIQFHGVKDSVSLCALREIYLFATPKFYFWKLSSGQHDSDINSDDNYFTSYSGINQLDLQNKIKYDFITKMYYQEYTPPKLPLKKSFAVKGYSNDDVLSSYYQILEQDSGSDGDIKGNAAITAGGSRSPEIKPSWTAENPKIYKALFQVKVLGGRDSMSVFQYVGIRSQARIRKGQLFLNSKPITFKPIFFRTIYGSNQEIKSLMYALKQNHINTIVVSNYMPNYGYHLCDTLGIYVVHLVDSTAFDTARQMNYYGRGYCSVIGQLEVQNLSSKKNRFNYIKTFSEVRRQIPLNMLLVTCGGKNLNDLPNWNKSEVAYKMLSNLRSQYAPVIFSIPNLESASVKVLNHYDYTNLDESQVKLTWELLENDLIVQNGIFQNFMIEPHQSKELTIDIKPFSFNFKNRYALRFKSEYKLRPFWAKDSIINQQAFVLNMQVK